MVVRGTICVLVVVPLVFLAVYPVIILLLPERIARLADLPRDFTVLFLLDVLIVPVAGIVLYWYARRRAAERI